MSAAWLWTSLSFLSICSSFDQVKWHNSISVKRPTEDAQMSSVRSVYTCMLAKTQPLHIWHVHFIPQAAWQQFFSCLCVHGPQGSTPLYKECAVELVLTSNNGCGIKPILWVNNLICQRWGQFVSYMVTKHRINHKGIDLKSKAATRSSQRK